MKRKRSYIIDKKFQYGKSIKVVGAVTILLAFIILAVGVIISLNNHKTSKNNKLIMSNTENINRILDLQQSIYMRFSMIPYGVDQQTYSRIAVELTKDYNNSIKNLNASSLANEEIIKSNNNIIIVNTILIIAIIVMTFSGLGILFTMLIRHTHRISGPIYLMTMYGNEILNGKKPNMRKLRDKDEFGEFYEIYKKICAKAMKNK